MAAPPDLPAALVDRIERLMTTSAAVVRDRVYEVLGAAGVDVERLVRDTRMEVVDELKAKAERRAILDRMLRQRVASGQLPPEKLEAAKARLAAAPETAKAMRQALKRVEARPLPQPPSAPTRELIRHKGEEPTIRDREPDGTPLSAPRYSFEWAVDRMSAPMSAEEYQALTRLREAYLRRQNTPKGVDWNGAGGTHPGPRLPISDMQLRAGYEWNAIWYKLDPSLRLIVTNFVLEETPRGHQAPLTAIEFGKLYGATKDPNRARGVTVGALRTSAAVIARLFHEYDQHKAKQRREGRG